METLETTAQVSTVFSSEPGTGLFPVSYFIGTGKPQDSTVKLQLLVNTVTKSIMGHGQLVPLNTSALLIPFTTSGNYWINPQLKEKIWVSLECNVFNMTINIVLSKGWKEGVAGVQYFDKEWKEFNASVRLLHNNN